MRPRVACVRLRVARVCARVSRRVCSVEPGVVGVWPRVWPRRPLGPSDTLGRAAAGFDPVGGGGRGGRGRGVRGGKALAAPGRTRATRASAAGAPALAACADTLSRGYISSLFWMKERWERDGAAHVEPGAPRARARASPFRGEKTLEARARRAHRRALRIARGFAAPSTRNPPALRQFGHACACGLRSIARAPRVRPIPVFLHPPAPLPSVAGSADTPRERNR